MESLDLIAEQTIRAAIESGALDNPLAGQPLPPDESSGVPEELRLSYKVLRNAGMLPEELELRRETLRLRDLLEACGEAGERASIERRLHAAWLRYEILMERRRASPALRAYQTRIAARLAR